MVKIKIYKAAKIGMVLLTIDKAIVISTFLFWVSKWTIMSLHMVVYDMMENVWHWKYAIL